MIPDSFKQNEFVLVNWFTLETVSNPFASDSFSTSNLESRQDYQDLQLIPIDIYMHSYQSIPVISRDGVKKPAWPPGSYPKSRSGYQKWNYNSPPKYPDGTSYWSADLIEANFELITASQYYSKYWETTFSYLETPLPEQDYPIDQRFSTDYWVFVFNDNLVYNLPETPAIIVDCASEKPSESIADCNNVQIYSIKKYLLEVAPRPYNKNTGQPFFEPGSYPLNHDGSFQLWSDKNIPK
jgi:hypothetical protein